MAVNYLYNLMKQQTGTLVGSKNAADVNVANSTDLVTGLIPFQYDFISADLSGATTDVYTYKTGGSGGTTVAVVTLTYTDASKETLSTVARV